MALKTAMLRILQTLLRGIQLCCAIVACGIFAFFLAVLAKDDISIETYVRAVTGMAGAAIIYTAFAVILTLCLAGNAFLGILAIVLDICFMGCFAAIAYYSRGGAASCNGEVNTPLGTGDVDQETGTLSLGRACTLSTAVFAVSIVAIFLFLITAIMQVFLIRQHKRDKRYGPSPSNNYTSGTGRRPFWKRRFGKKHASTNDAEMATSGQGQPNYENSYMASTNHGVGADPKYGQTSGNAPYHQPGNNAATNY